MSWRSLLGLLCCCRLSTCFMLSQVVRPPRSICSSSVSIVRNAASRRDPGATEEESGGANRRGFLGLLFPVAVVAAANAPFLALMASPPDEETLDQQKADWCKSDYCTLLGGGAGFGSGGGGGSYGDYVEPTESNDEAARILKAAGI
mmetsp:Transcript_20000/g.39717  ORF Transcript_20000/g.39717 Transcript_20000/m.39717 type:complete len:147 (+) Transcript_20000:239-679(+)